MSAINRRQSLQLIICTNSYKKWHPKTISDQRRSRDVTVTWQFVDVQTQLPFLIVRHWLGVVLLVTVKRQYWRQRWRRSRSSRWLVSAATWRRRAFGATLCCWLGLCRRSAHVRLRLRRARCDVTVWRVTQRRVGWCRELWRSWPCGRHIRRLSCWLRRGGWQPWLLPWQLWSRWRS